MRHDPTRHGDDDTPRVYVIHENDAWLEPLRREFEAQGVPYAEWFLDRGTLDLGTEPPANEQVVFEAGNGDFPLDILGKPDFV